MSVYKPAKSRFFQYDFVISGNRFHGSTGQITRRAAEKAEERIRREVGEGKFGSAESLTLNQAAGRWWDDIGKHRGDSVDVDRRVTQLIAILGKNAKVSDIDAEAVATAIRRRRGMAYTKSPKAGAKEYLPGPATVNRDIIETLRPILRYADELWSAKGLRVKTIRWGKLRLQEPAGETRTYSDAESAAWRAECGPATGLALEMLLTYGLRFGELFFGLADFDPSGPRLSITRRLRSDGEFAKGRKRDTGAHVLPLRLDHAREIAARLGRARAYNADLPGGQEPLDHIWYVEEVSKRTGKVKLLPLTYHGMESRLSSAADRAGVAPGRRIHTARHHAGTAALRKSGNLRTAQRLLGHANIRSTVRYAHALEEDVRAALADEIETSPRNNPEARKAKGE